MKEIHIEDKDSKPAAACQPIRRENPGDKEPAEKRARKDKIEGREKSKEEKPKDIKGVGVADKEKVCQVDKDKNKFAELIYAHDVDTVLKFKTFLKEKVLFDW